MAQFSAVFNLASLATGDGSKGFEIRGASAYDLAGTFVSGVGDINGDGIGDVAVGAENADPTGKSSGSTYVIYGKKTATAGNFNPVVQLSSLNGGNGFRLDGENSYDESGGSISGIGDVNGDGFQDLLIGARWGEKVKDFYSGTAYVIFGSNLGFAKNISLESLNGTNGYRIGGSAASDRFGNAVSSAGDFNGDGIADFIIGAPRMDGGGPSSGGAAVIFGRKGAAPLGTANGTLDIDSLNGQNGFRIHGEFSADFAGQSVASAGDVNGDGISDIIVGAYNAYDSQGTATGASYVLFGRKADANNPFAADFSLKSVDGVNGFKINGVQPQDGSGISVTSAGDLNGDGVADLAIGAHHANQNQLTDSGAVYIVFGRNRAKDGAFPKVLELQQLKPDSTAANYGFTIEGLNTGDLTGISVANAGDINADGVSDLIIGAKRVDNNGIDSGSAYVIFGKKTATAGPFEAILNLSKLNGQNGFRIDGVSASDLTGSSVSSAGDINGDGIADLIIGAPAAGDASNLRIGKAYVLFGQIGNRAPVLASAIADQKASPGTAFNFLIPAGAFTDADNDKLTYKVTQQAGTALPSWLKFDPNTNSLFGTPGATDVGTLRLTVSVDDGSGSTATDTFDLVVGVNRTPTVATAIANQTATPDTAFVFAIPPGTFADADGDTLTYSVALQSGTALPAWLKFDAATKTLSGTPTSTDATTLQIVVTADDGNGGKVTDTFDLVVAKKASPTVGDDLANKLVGTTSADVLTGNGGDDILIGGQGADALDGGAGIDTASYANAKSGVKVSLVAGAVNTGDALGDTFIGIENLSGSKFKDTLTGDDAINRISGGKQADVLTGNGGTDIFVFAIGDGKDVITDFVGKGTDHDVIDLSAYTGVTSWKDLTKNHLTISGDDLIISNGTGNSIRLMDTDRTEIVRADFTF